MWRIFNFLLGWEYILYKPNTYDAKIKPTRVRILADGRRYVKNGKNIDYEVPFPEEGAHQYDYYLEKYKINKWPYLTKIKTPKIKPDMADRAEKPGIKISSQRG